MSYSSVSLVENQQEHPRKRSFPGELRDLLRAHKVEFDERDLPASFMSSRSAGLNGGFCPLNPGYPSTASRLAAPWARHMSSLRDSKGSQAAADLLVNFHYPYQLTAELQGSAQGTVRISSNRD